MNVPRRDGSGASALPPKFRPSDIPVPFQLRLGRLHLPSCATYRHSRRIFTRRSAERPRPDKEPGKQDGTQHNAYNRHDTTQRGAPRFPVSSFYCGQILRGLQEQPGYNFISCSPEAEKARILSYTHLPAILLLQASFCSSLFARLIQLYDRKSQPHACFSTAISIFPRASTR